MRPWLEQIEAQDRFVYEAYEMQHSPNQPYIKDPLSEIKLARGQFFQVFKLISKELTQVKCPIDCPKSTEEYLDIQLVMKKPFPNLLLFNFVWDHSDFTATNSLAVMASLPWEGFIPNFYTAEHMQDEAIFKTIYKLQSMVLYTGNHYYTILRVNSSLTRPGEKEWHLLNDEEIQVDMFREWTDVILYIL